MKSKFLKPSRLKISVFFFLSVLSFVFTVAAELYGFFCEPICPFMDFYWLVFVALFLVSVVINYFISCFLIWLYHKFKKVRNNEI
jgi:hypothetical protein